MALQRNVLGEILCRAVIARKYDIQPRSVNTYRSEKGKPFYKDHPDWFFNISHSAEWVVLAFSGQNVGIDIEKVKPINYHLAKRFFSIDENEILDQLEEPEKRHYFFDLWTLKESYLKYLGRGLTKPLSTFTIEKKNDRFILKHDPEHDETVYFKQYNIGEQYKLSVCSTSEIFTDNISFLKMDELIQIIKV
jgi:4'-phosphopantetheinyl transferase